MLPAFVRHGPRVPASPLVFAVPHAGQDYPPALLANAVLPQDRLAMLEDRLVDRLLVPLIAAGATAIVATRARAWIDLNRDPREIDVAMVDGALPGPAAIATARLRGGLGLIPRRIAGATISHARLPAAEIGRRIAEDHRPYHAAIADALDAAAARFGTALLVDCHSMPPLAADPQGHRSDAVIGDLFGRSAAPRFALAAARSLRDSGLRVACNRPYAGGFTLERHAAPSIGRHAIQIELCRSLYLQPGLRDPGPGLPATAAALARLAESLAATIDDHAFPAAAE
ncbi:N-formylglutamate amidohydrolase [Sphingomonas sp. 1P06PA]|uniref:N-formylglutamate amidohydrolase n=1 Tax=Sphingomonas sp. 1P06PA TaxID=554121 RepID=UPI0039A51CBD